MTPKDGTLFDKLLGLAEKLNPEDSKKKHKERVP